MRQQKSTTKKKRSNSVTTKITEKQLESAILDYLNILPKCYAIKVNNTGIFDPNRKVYRTLKNKHSPKGVSDIVGSYNGRALFIEVKAPGKIKNVSKEQMEFLERMRQTGAIAFAADSIDVVEKELINEC